MSLKVQQGRTIRLPAEFFAGEAAADPISPLVQILDPSNVRVVTDAVPESDGVGLYHYDFAVAADAPIGSWTARWTATINGESVSGEDAFEVLPRGSVAKQARLLTPKNWRKEKPEAESTDPTPLAADLQESPTESEVPTAAVKNGEAAGPLEDSKAIQVEEPKRELADEAIGFTVEPEVAPPPTEGKVDRLRAALATSHRARLAALGLVLLLGLVVAILFAVRTSKSEDPELTLQEGIDAHLDGDLDKASVQYRKTLESDPNNKLAHYNLGVIEQVRDRPQQAERYYLRALRQDPNFVPALFNLAFIKGELGDNQAAVDLYRRVISLNPNLAAAHLNLGAILRRIGQVPEGDAEIRRALELDPTLRRRVSSQARPQPAP